MHHALFALLLSLPHASAVTPPGIPGECDFALIPPRHIAADGPMRVRLGQIMSTRRPRPSGPPPFPGTAGVREAEDAKQAAFWDDLARRIVDAGLVRRPDDATSTSPDRDCVIESLSRIERGDFNLAAFLADGGSYLRARFLPVVTPVPGDLLIYSKFSGPLPRGMNHFAIVASVDAEGEVIAESKFGTLPGTYLHRLDEAPDYYGEFVHILRKRPAPVVFANPRAARPKPPFPGALR